MEKVRRYFSEKRGGTQSAVAAAAGISVSHLSLVLSGRRKASYEVIEKLCRATNGALQPNDFFDTESGAGSPEAAA